MIQDAEAQGSWIFVSHSHRDLAKVRRIRNALEERGHNPLLFFLKCLDDDSEVDDLVRREIEARTWFVLCDSPNARDSRWVQTETDIIKSLEGKGFVVIDLDEEFEEQVRKIERISKRATVYIAYAHHDQGIAQSIASALREEDYAVVAREESDSEEDLASAIAEWIRPAMEKGFFLLLLSPDAVRSRWIQSEALAALDLAEASGQHASIIPVVVRDHEATVSLLSSSPELGRSLAGIPLLRTFEAHGSAVRTCAVSPDGSFIVSGSEDGTLGVWDASRVHKLASLRGHADSVLSCAISPDSSVIVSGSADKTLRLWDSGSGEVLARLAGHTDRVSACAFSPDGSFIVSGSGDRTLRLWDARSREVLATLAGHRDRVLACAISPDGTYIISGSADGAVVIWDARSGRYRGMLGPHDGAVPTAAISADGSLIVSGSADGSMRIWDPSGGLRARLEHDGGVTACAVSRDVSFIVSGSGDRTVTVWDASTPMAIARIPLLGWVASIAIHPRLPVVAAGDARGNLNLIDLEGIPTRES